MGQPTEEAIKAFAAQIGIDEDSDFMWIAEVGISSPIPPKWDSHCDDTGFVYYVNRDTSESTWENPLVPYLKQVVWVANQWPVQQSDEWMNEQIASLWAVFKDDLETWHGPYETDVGQLYFINSFTEVSSWEDPRIEAQYLFELQCGLLSKIQEVPVRSGLTPGFGGDSNEQLSPSSDQADIFGCEKAVPHRISQSPADKGSPTNRVPATKSDTSRPGNATEQSQTKPVSLQDLRKKLSEKLARVDPEQADMERRMVAASMRDQLRQVYNFLQSEQDTYEMQLQRKKNERQRRIVASQIAHREEENVPPTNLASRFNKKNLSIETNTTNPRIVTRKFRRAAFSRMQLEDVKGPPQSPSNIARAPLAPPVN